VLESGGEGDAPRGTVFVRLLGPFAGRAGEPLTLCWRLERGGAAPSAVRERPLATGFLRRCPCRSPAAAARAIWLRACLRRGRAPTCSGRPRAAARGGC